MDSYVHFQSTEKPEETQTEGGFGFGFFASIKEFLAPTAKSPEEKRRTENRQSVDPQSVSNSTPSTSNNTSLTNIESVPAPSPLVAPSHPAPNIPPQQTPLSAGKSAPQVPVSKLTLAKEKKLVAELKKRIKDTKDQVKENRCYGCKIPFGMFTSTYVCELCCGVFDRKCAPDTVSGRLLGKIYSCRVCTWCQKLLSRPAFNVDNVINQVLQSINSTNYYPGQNDLETEELVFNKRATKGSASEKSQAKVDATTSAGPTGSKLLPSSSYLGSNPRASDSKTKLSRGMSIRAGDALTHPPSVMSLSGIDGSSTAREAASNVGAMLSSAGNNEDLHIDNVFSTPQKKTMQNIKMKRFDLKEEEGLKFNLSDSDKARQSREAKSSETTAASSTAPAPTPEPLAMPLVPLMMKNTTFVSRTQLYLDSLVDHFLRVEGVEEPNEWKSLILKHCMTVAKDIAPQLFFMNRTNERGFKKDFYDVRNYVKIVKIPGGHMSDWKYIRGTVFKKDPVHKKMKENFEAPRILLLSCSIEYNPLLAKQQKEQLRLHVISLDDIHIGEEDYLHTVVNEIAVHKPDIIFVQGNVARLAQEFFFELGICVFCNVKPIVMRILSRVCCTKLHTGLPKASEEVSLGTCGTFDFHSYEIPPVRKKAMIKRSASYCFVGGCKKELFASIIIRGTLDHSLLDKIKRVLTQTCFIAYNLEKELAFLHLHPCTLRIPPKIPTRPTQGVLSLSPLVVFPEAWSLSPGYSWLMPYLLKERPNHPNLITTSLLQHNLIDTTTDEDRAGLDIQCNFNYIFEKREVAERIAEEVISNHYAKESYALSDISELSQFIYLHSLCNSETSRFCISHELHLIDFYSNNDISLGDFLLQFCFDKSFVCRATQCNRDIAEHERSFIHHQGRVNVLIVDQTSEEEMLKTAHPADIFFWTKCHGNNSTRWMKLNYDVLSYSFGKFLELIFYGGSIKCEHCHASLHHLHIKYFYSNSRVVQFTYEPVEVLEIVMPQVHGLGQSFHSHHDQAMPTSPHVSHAHTPVPHSPHQPIHRDASYTHGHQSKSQSNLFTPSPAPFTPSASHSLASMADSAKSDSMADLLAESTLEKSHSTDIHTNFVAAIQKRESMHEQLAPEYGDGFSRFVLNQSTDSVSLVDSQSTESSPVYSPLSDRDSHVKAEREKQLHSEKPPTQHARESRELEVPTVSIEISPSPRLGDTLSQPAHRRRSSSTGQSLSLRASHSPDSGLSPRTSPRNSPRGSPRNSNNGLIDFGKRDSDDSDSARRSSFQNSANNMYDNYFTSPTVQSHSPSSHSTSFLSDSSTQASVSPQPQRSAQPSRDSVQTAPSRESSQPVVQANAQTVFYDRPASLIAYALTSNKYIKLLDNDRQTTNVPNLLSMKSTADDARHESIADFSNLSASLGTSGSGPNTSGSSNNYANNAATRLPPNAGERPGQKSVSTGPLAQAVKIPLQFNYKGGAGNMHFYCDVYYASQFEQLRLACGISDKDFCDSMRDSSEFNPKGGKSGVSFSKTHDERFLLKNVSNIEGESFIEFAPQYFDYFDKVIHHQVPTAIAKIFGIYGVQLKNNSEKFFVIVMENLFYGKKILKTFDLKGSLRSRHVDSTINENVLLDENLLEIMFENPILVDQMGKSLLGMTVWNDTLFLSKLNVMDYSLIAGIDDCGRLICGIIDYLRRYTWDKQLESWVKKTSSILSPNKGRPANKIPTIVSPKQYQRRFRYAIWRYFIQVPNKRTYLGRFDQNSLYYYYNTPSALGAMTNNAMNPAANNSANNSGTNDAASTS